MTEIIKDLISLFIYLVITPFCRYKKAIFVYHSVEDIDTNKDPYKINVKPVLFERQVQHISRSKDNYILTFDDGYENIYTNAFPILKRYNIKPIVFLTTDYIDSKTSLNKFFDNKYTPQPLKWEQIKRMHAWGAEIGSHTVTHTNIAQLDSNSVYIEAYASKKRIEGMIGKRVTSFSYPFGNAGSFSKNAENILRGLGYTRAYTNIMGMDNSLREPFKIRRIRIYGTDNMFRFKLKIAGAYNWVDLFSSKMHTHNILKRISP